MHADLTEIERKSVVYALRHSRGRYTAARASQLSGVPKSTVYDWRKKNVYTPDYTAADPTMWSYRDLVLLRVLAWLRQGGMDRPLAAEKVASIKTQLSDGIEIRFIHATRKDVVLNSEDDAVGNDDRENLLPSSDFFSLLGTFDLHEPIVELRSARRGSIWAPDLVTPSQHSFISPWVLAGDPCVQRTRIPTSALHALSAERELPTDAIVELYPGLTAAAVEDAISLERRLRGDDIPTSAAA